MKRQIIQIDEEKCTGCGECIPNCHEGALQMIDGKARLISDLMCDGLGACIGHCPEGAIEIIEREAQSYDEIAVIKDMVLKGKNVVIAHLAHLKDHQEFGYLKQGIKWMQENKSGITFDIDEVISKVHNGITAQEEPASSSCGCGGHEEQPKLSHQHAHEHQHQGGGCPGSASKSFSQPQTINSMSNTPSQLTHWPVQMHLINPSASHFQGSDLLLAADCVAFSLGNFHSSFLKGKTLAIACPKLDSNKEVYIEKLIALIDSTRVNIITVMKMEVPCCGGILQMVQIALQQASRKVPVKSITVSITGEIISEDWI
ncbi:MAG: 4Fe-4S ferredoxin [Bacteroidetes bacterium GWA2_31_9b]|nr:MAG: 4Fe-4S ferredoxin [Bacteroidetes bacterium GWA2_31_9b]